MKYLLIGLIGYFILKRIMNIKTAVSNDRPAQKGPSDKHGGEYVDYEEID